MKTLFSIVFLLLAIIGLIVIFGTLGGIDCMSIRQGVLRVDKAKTVIHSGHSRLYYSGVILETGERQRITHRDFDTIYPNLFQDFNLLEKFRVQDTFFDLDVFYQGYYVSINKPQSCLYPEAYRQDIIGKRFTACVLIFPLFLWIFYNTYKYLKTRKALVLIPFFLVTTLTAQDTAIDTIRIFTAQVSTSSGEVFLYPANTFITKSELDKSVYLLFLSDDCEVDSPKC
jgi:hypothetical protein